MAANASRHDDAPTVFDGMLARGAASPITAAETLFRRVRLSIGFSSLSW
jgi:hypothetical protein